MSHIINKPIKDHELQWVVNDLVALRREIAFDLQRATESKNKQVIMTEKRLEVIYNKIEPLWAVIADFGRRHIGGPC